MKKVIAFFLAVVSVLTCVSMSFVTAFAASADVAEMDGVTFQNVKTGQYLNFDYGTLKNGTPLRVWSWDGSKEQLFDIDNVKGDTYRILTHSSSKFCVDVYRGNAKLKAGQLCDIWKTGDDTTAQNVKFYLCDDGSVIIRMAANKNLALSASGAKSRVKLAKFNSSDKAQKWIVKDENGKNVSLTAGKITESVVTAGAYRKTGTVYTVGSKAYYLAVTTRAYSGVPSNTEFWIDENNNVVTDASVINKLIAILIFNLSKNNMLSASKDWVFASGEFYDIYTNILATEKLGEIVGQGSGMLLSIGTGNAVSLKGAAFDMVEDAISIDNIKTAAYLSMLKIYCNNAEVYGNQAVKLMSKEITDYDVMLKAREAYANTAASAAAVDYLVGDDIRSMANSNTYKELAKYFKNVFSSFAESMLPDAEVIEIVSDLKDNISDLITLNELAESCGVLTAYNQAYKKNLTPISNSTVNTVSQKLAKEEIIPDKYVADDLQGKVKALKNKYKEGKTKTTLFTRANAWQCHGFACEALMDFWGTAKPTPTNEDYVYYKATSKNGYVSKIRPGDMVRYRNGDFDHTIVVTNVDDNYIYYADCNADGKCTFKYNQSIKRATLEKLMKKNLLDAAVSTRGYVCHYVGNNL